METRPVAASRAELSACTQAHSAASPHGVGPDNCQNDKHIVSQTHTDELSQQEQNVLKAFLERKRREFLEEERAKVASKMAAKRARDKQREATVQFCQQKQLECDTQLTELTKEQSAENLQEERMLQKIDRKRKRDVTRKHQMEFLKQQLENMISKREEMEEARRDDEQQVMDLQEWMEPSLVELRVADKVAHCTMTMDDLINFHSASLRSPCGDTGEGRS